SIYRHGRAPETAAAPTDPLLATLLKHNLELASELPPEKNLSTLAALARELDGETRNLARVAGEKELMALADLYDDVVRKGVLARADDVPLADREKVLTPIAGELFAASTAAKRLAEDVPASAAAPLKKIAAAADEGNRVLRIK